MAYTVILVDDEPLCLRGMVSSFKWSQYGFEIVYKTTNQETALEMIKELDPDVVCTDMRMPKISGIDLIKAARAMNAKAKFIIVSGFEDFEKACEAIRYNAFRYCLKPIDREEADDVLRELKQILDQEHPEQSESQNTAKEEIPVSIQNQKFQKMVQYIDAHYKDSFNLEELAKKFDLNASFASRLFSQHFSMGFSQYVNKIRTAHAAELLVSTKISVEEIGLAVGYRDTAYFSKVFKKYYGEAPYAWRCRNQ